MTEGPAGSALAGLSARELTKFARLLGRQPDEAEQVKLFRIKDSLGLDENDEVWTFVLALQHYEFLYEQHPAQIESAVKASIAELQAAAQKVVQAEVSRTRGLLERAVAAAATSVAKAQAETARRLSWWWAGAGLSLFGGFTLVCGYELGRGGLPFWMRREIGLEGDALAKVAGAVLGAPAGWVALLLLLPVCWSWGRRGMVRALEEEEATRARVSAAAQVLGAISGFLAAAATLLWLVGSVAVGVPAHERAARQAGFLAGAEQSSVAASSQTGQTRPVHRTR